MVPLIIWSPRGTETFRWCLWCFLFGESFFVPAAMWLRLLLHDSAGRVFGRRRLLVFSLYLTMCMVIPIYGMIQELK